MKKLTDDLKRILAGLAYQDAGEFLTTAQKYEVLGMGRAKDVQGYVSHKTGEKANKRIGLISNEKGDFTVLDQVISDCIELNAQLDLLQVGQSVANNLGAVEAVLGNAGVRYQLVDAQHKTPETFVRYIQSHPSLAFLVAEKGNDFVKEMIKEVESVMGSYLPMPMVYIKQESQYKPHLIAASI